MNIPGELIPIVAILVAPVLAIGVPLVRGLTKRWADQAAQPRLPAEVLARLERMEQAIDSVAVEIERISEGQRFTTKLLSERARDGALPNGSPNHSAR